jgi:hypothetical protein
MDVGDNHVDHDAPHSLMQHNPGVRHGRRIRCGLIRALGC